MCSTTITEYLNKVNEANIDDSDFKLLVDESVYTGLFIVLLYLHFSNHLGGSGGHGR